MYYDYRKKGAVPINVTIIIYGQVTKAVLRCPSNNLCTYRDRPRLSHRVITE